MLHTYELTILYLYMYAYVTMLTLFCTYVSFFHLVIIILLLFVSGPYCKTVYN